MQLISVCERSLCKVFEFKCTVQMQASVKSAYAVYEISLSCLLGTQKITIKQVHIHADIMGAFLFYRYFLENACSACVHANDTMRRSASDRVWPLLFAAQVHFAVLSLRMDVYTVWALAVAFVAM